MSEETKLERIEREALEKAAQPEEGSKKENTESTEKPEMVFADFGFEEELLDSLQMMRFINPTPIQQQAIPLIQEGRDLIACAQTGTGKTAAFLLPIINKIQKENIQNSNTLIVVPTRELAQQIDRQMEGFAYTMNVTSIAIYGGKNPGAWGNQQRALKQGTQLIIGTPGRLLAHLDFKYANLDAVEHLVLDEADRMLDMGFSEDLVKIIKRLPNRKQTLMFSATMPPKIRTLAKEILTDPGEITIALSQPAEGITQTAYMAYEPQKLPLLRTILKDKKDINIVIFCSSKKSTKLIARQLKKEKFSVAEMHSELAQEDREIAIQKFRANRIRILVATDVMSRGIDINNIGMVINYDVPHDAEDYIHRIGRTARAKSEGEAVTFITDRDAYKFKNIEKLMKRTVEKIGRAHV